MTAKAIVQCAVEWYQRLARRGYHALWDLRGQPVRIEIEELMFGLDDHLAWVNEHRKGQRHAYLVTSRVAMYLARDLKARVKLDWDVFDDEQLARDWLRTGDARYAFDRFVRRSQRTVTVERGATMTRPRVRTGVVVGVDVAQIGIELIELSTFMIRKLSSDGIRKSGSGSVVKIGPGTTTKCAEFSAGSAASSDASRFAS